MFRITFVNISYYYLTFLYLRLLSTTTDFYITYNIITYDNNLRIVSEIIKHNYEVPLFNTTIILPTTIIKD